MRGEGKQYDGKTERKRVKNKTGKKKIKAVEHKTQSLQAYVKIVSDLFLFIKSAVKHPPAPLFASPGVLPYLEIHFLASAVETTGFAGK